MAKREYLVPICVFSHPEDLAIQLLKNYTGPLPEYFTALPITSVYNRIVIDNKRILLILKPNVGISFHTKQEFYYRGALGAIFAFSKTTRCSIMRTKEFYQDFRKYVPHSDVSVAIICVSNESEAITSDEVQSLAKELGANYYEIKETDKQTLAEIFSFLTRKALKNLSRLKPEWFNPE